ncbi:hypothetical protein V7S43_016655 [Phytophthora oleae]|uniref:Uncharacterized protein n=1 Tax=Phytophthora oleae TaxID=2107226 RepID=A0ABD3EVB9_9STRA
MITSDDDDENIPALQQGLVSSGPGRSCVIAAVTTLPSFGTPRKATTSDVDALFIDGLLSEADQPVADILHYDIPPDRTVPHPIPEGRSFLVGVSAYVEDFREKRHVANTYGGPCALVCFEDFTDEDSAELGRVVPDFSQKHVLCPRADSRPNFDLDGALNSIEVRKEVASILAHLPHSRLTKRAFRTTGLLKVMTGAHRKV